MIFVLVVSSQPYIGDQTSQGTRGTYAVSMANGNHHDNVHIRKYIVDHIPPIHPDFSPSISTLIYYCLFPCNYPKLHAVLSYPPARATAYSFAISARGDDYDGVWDMDIGNDNYCMCIQIDVTESHSGIHPARTSAPLGGCCANKRTATLTGHSLPSRMHTTPPRCTKPGKGQIWREGGVPSESL